MEMTESWKLYTLIIKKAGELLQQDDTDALRNVLKTIKGSSTSMPSKIKMVRTRGIPTPVKHTSEVIFAKHPDIKLFNEQKNARKSSKVIEVKRIIKE